MPRSVRPHHSLLISLFLTLASVAKAEVTIVTNATWARHTIDNSSHGADGVRLRDVNADGLPDIATGWEEGGVIRVYLHPGYANAKQSWPAVTVGAVKSPEDAVLVDLDSDGAFDVVSSCEGRERTMFFHWAPNVGDPPLDAQQRQRFLDPAVWTTVAVPVTKDQQSWMFALPMDVDGRHGIDLIVGSKGTGAGIGWLESPPDARDVAGWKYHRLRDAGWIMSLEAFDMDGDGDLDVLFSDRKGARRGVFWLSNPGPQQAKTAAAWQEMPVGALDREVMFLDVQTDPRGLPHVAVAVKPNSAMMFLMNRSTAVASWDATEYKLPPSRIGTAKSVRITDFKTMQFVFSCEQASGGKTGVVEVRPVGSNASDQVSPERFSIHDISGPTGVKYDLLQLVDMDGDGDRDIVTCEERANLGVFWYENPQR
jgi:hypothetical protein